MTGLLRVLDGAYELRRLQLGSINRSLALEQLLWQLARTRRDVYKRQISRRFPSVALGPPRK